MAESRSLSICLLLLLSLEAARGMREGSTIACLLSLSQRLYAVTAMPLLRGVPLPLPRLLLELELLLLLPLLLEGLLAVGLMTEGLYANRGVKGEGSRDGKGSWKRRFWATSAEWGDELAAWIRCIYSVKCQNYMHLFWQ